MKDRKKVPKKKKKSEANTPPVVVSVSDAETQMESAILFPCIVILEEMLLCKWRQKIKQNNA